MAKAVLYAKIQLPTCFIHVFNTHLNAWAAPKAVEARRQQCEQIGSFIASLDIPKTEYVFLGGDLNVCVYEHAAAVDSLCTSMGGLELIKPDQVSFSSDPLTNVLVGTDDASEYITRSKRNGCYDEFMQTGQCLCCPRQLLDVIGNMRLHTQPRNVRFEVLPLKSRTPFTIHINRSNVKTISDVSDHYPVILRCELDGSEQFVPSVESVESSISVDVMPPNGVSTGWAITVVVFTLAYFIVLASFAYGVSRVRFT